MAILTRTLLSSTQAAHSSMDKRLGGLELAAATGLGDLAAAAAARLQVRDWLHHIPPALELFLHTRPISGRHCQLFCLLAPLQETLTALETRLGTCEGAGREMRRLAVRLADTDAHSAETAGELFACSIGLRRPATACACMGLTKYVMMPAGKLAGVAATLPVLTRQVSALDTRLSNKLVTAQRALEALMGQLMSLGMMAKVSPSKNPLAGADEALWQT